MKEQITILTFLAKLAVVSVLLFANSGCNQQPKESESKASVAVLQKGKALMNQYCQSCHLLVEPQFLPKQTWKKDVLPRMGNFLGFYSDTRRNELMESGAAKQILTDRYVFPEKPLIDSTEWEYIKNYILTMAPDSLTSAEVGHLEVRETFKIRESATNINPPMSTMVQFEPNSGLIYHGDVKGDYSTINIFDNQGAIIQSLGLRYPAVEVAEKPEGLVALLMGSFNSTDAPSGSLVVFSKANKSKEYNKMQTLIKGLRRPVDMEFADLDNDGDEDIVISEFGNWAGQLRWFKNNGEGNYEPQLLHQKTGVIKSISDDLNGDGLLDIMALVAQGDESIYAFANKGNGQFDAKRIMQFPPTYGSVNFDYTDITGDGIKDIIHVAGDNADYEAVLKPYHGIRVYAGKEGDTSFSDPFFLPVNGAYKSQIADFDNDGDLDIAAISFFPDYTTGAKESLLMFENVSVKDSLGFRPFTINGFDKGRFNVMTSGDINSDGAQDLMLGSFVIDDPYSDKKIVQKLVKKFPMLLILENEWEDRAEASQTETRAKEK